MEWGLDLDWYDCNASWRPYIPLKPEGTGESSISKSGNDWFFDFEMSTPWERLSTGVFIIPTETRQSIDEDLLHLSGCVDKITTNHPFPFSSARPPPHDLGFLLRAFDTSEELQAAGCSAKRMAVDYLGFLSWWTASISGWDAELDHHVATYLAGIQLHRFRKRGVLVDLERDWRHINISNLVRHRVPLAYHWGPALAASPRFTALSPTVLRAYDEQWLEVQGDIHSSALKGLENEIAVMLKFDRFFQELCVEGRPDPSVDFDDDWRYYVVDFQGWSHRNIPLCVAREYYVRFGSSVGHEEGGTMVLFRRWESLNNFATSTQPTESMEIEGNASMVRGSSEIRELHRSKHAPGRHTVFDWDGRPSSRRDSLQAPSGRACPQRERRQNNISSVSRRWLSQMAGEDTRSEGGSQSELRSSPSYSSREQVSNTPSRSSSHAGARNRSASPGPRAY